MKPRMDVDIQRRGAPFEPPPPGAGVVTVMGKFPTMAPVIADAGIRAVRCALST